MSAPLTVKAHKGDAMTLLAFNLLPSALQDFIGFSIRIKANKINGNFKLNYFLFNKLTFKKSIIKKNNLQDKDLRSTEFSPIQKFNWVHVPSTNHNIEKPYYGDYIYEVTPRYMVDDILQPLDNALTKSITIDVSPFAQKNFSLGFTRGFVASQAYVDHFGKNNKVRPNQKDLLFDTKEVSGSVKDKNNNDGVYTFEDQFKWMGWQARERIYEMLGEVLANKKMSLDVFAYDLDEPFICETLLTLAKEDRVRIILDNATLHTGKDAKGNVAFEDAFETIIKDEIKKPSLLVRGRFARFSHSKVFIQKLHNKPVKVLTGSTNFSTNGLYINANHVLIFSNKKIAQLYEDVFENSFGADKMKIFSDNDLAKVFHEFKKVRGIPDMTIGVSPHSAAFAAAEINGMAQRVKDAKSDVLFAIMNDTTGSGDLLQTIRELHAREDIFTYGIVDKSSDITLYKPGSKKGVRVAGAGVGSQLPPPFKEEVKTPGVTVHHKFIVVDFKGKDPVVYCGSSNLAQLAETQNGDNLLAIRDKNIVTAFAIEAMRLVDHFHFRSRQKKSRQQKQELALRSDKTKLWYTPWFDTNDLRCVERVLLMKK